MKTINFSNKFIIGKNIIAIKKYIYGSVKIDAGDIGTVEDITIDSFPDLGFFDLKMIHMSFGSHKLGMEEKIALGYFNPV